MTRNTRLNSLNNGLKRIKLKWKSSQFKSPYLNPIEKLQHQVELSIKHKGSFKNVDELYKANEATWNEITHKKIDKLIESMPRKCWKNVFPCPQVKDKSMKRAKNILTETFQQNADVCEKFTTWKCTVI